MTLEIARNEDYKDFKRLFFSAFPAEERPPYFFMKWTLKRRKGELLIAREDGCFIGFVFLVSYRDLVYLFFFAVEDGFRGRGYGSSILQLVKERYHGKRIFLAREPLDDRAENAVQRSKRRDFYLKNGFVDLPMKITEKGYRFDTMSVGGPITPADYDDLVTDWIGKVLRPFVGMKAE